MKHFTVTVVCLLTATYAVHAQRIEHDAAQGLANSTLVNRCVRLDNSGYLSAANSDCLTSSAGGSPRTIIPLAYGSATTFVTASADDCIAAATNLNTTYKGFGSGVLVEMDSFTSATMYCRAKNAAAQVGTISLQVQNLTDSNTLIAAQTTTSTTCTTLTATVTGLAITGVKQLGAQVKSSVATDDPLFGSCVLVLEP